MTDDVKRARRSNEEVALDLAERAEKAKLRVLKKRAAPLLEPMAAIEAARESGDVGAMAPALNAAWKVLRDALGAQFPELVDGDGDGDGVS